MLGTRGKGEERIDAAAVSLSAGNSFPSVRFRRARDDGDARARLPGRYNLFE